MTTQIILTSLLIVKHPQQGDEHDIPPSAGYHLCDGNTSSAN